MLFQPDFNLTIYLEARRAFDSAEDMLISPVPEPLTCFP